MRPATPYRIKNWFSAEGGAKSKRRFSIILIVASSPGCGWIKRWGLTSNPTRRGKLEWCETKPGSWLRATGKPASRWLQNSTAVVAADLYSCCVWPQKLVCLMRPNLSTVCWAPNNVQLLENAARDSCCCCLSFLILAHGKNPTRGHKPARHKWNNRSRLLWRDIFVSFFFSHI